MRLTDFFDDAKASDPSIIIVEIPEKLLIELNLLTEGRWTQSKINGWSYRVDAANPSILTLRHVHVAKTKHINSKNQQASWNDDGSRHDKKSFNQKVGATSAAQTIARDALGLSDKIILEAIEASNGILLEAANLGDDLPQNVVLLRVAS